MLHAGAPHLLHHTCCITPVASHLLHHTCCSTPVASQTIACTALSYTCTSCCGCNLAGVNSTQALASLQQLDASAALALPGVTGVITAADIPGANSIMGAPLLANGCVEYVGQPIAYVAAVSQQLAETAAALVCVTYGPPPAGRTAVITLDDALASGAFYEDLAPLMQVAAVKPGAASSSSSSTSGPPDSSHAVAADVATSSCNKSAAAGAGAAACVERLIAGSPRKILGGVYQLPAQQHFYMETQVGR
jgi:xanthine dehydrogenase molybdopterin-binding subunit B